MVVALLFVFLGCADENEGVPKQCERVRDRLIDLQLADAMHVNRDAHRAVLRNALGPQFVSRCAESLTAKQRRCVIDARDLTSAQACGKT